MHCAYCGVDYSWEDFCRCLPPAIKTVPAPARVDVPWGEAVEYWSMRPLREPDLQPRAEA